MGAEWNQSCRQLCADRHGSENQAIKVTHALNHRTVLADRSNPPYQSILFQFLLNYSFFCLPAAVPGVKPRVCAMPGKHSTLKPHPWSSCGWDSKLTISSRRCTRTPWVGCLRSLLAPGVETQGSDHLPDCSRWFPRLLEARGSEESEVELIKSTSVVLRGSSENSEARPSASEPQLNTITNSPQGPRSRR